MAAAIIVSETVTSPTGRIVELLETLDPETVRLESGSQTPGEGGVRQVVELDLGPGEEPAVGDTVDVDDEGVATLRDAADDEIDPPDFDDVARAGRVLGGVVIPVGICSRDRAEYLMGAAAVAGGAIYVACPPVPGLTDTLTGTVYLCAGTLPSGEAVPTRRLDPDAVLERLAGEAARVARLAERAACLRESADELLAVLGDLCGRLGREVPADAEAARDSMEVAS